MTDRTERAPSAFRLNLEQQKNRAKDLLRAAKSGNAEARARLAAARGKSEAMTLAARRLRASSLGAETPQSPGGSELERLKLADAQFTIARELRFASWAKLKAHIEAMDRQRTAIDTLKTAPDADLKTLHIRCGSDIRNTLVEGGFGGDFLEYATPYCMGPVTKGPDRHELMARFITETFGPTRQNLEYQRVLEGLARDDERLTASAQDYERIVIWMEHDSYDQLVLARLLAHYAHAPRPRVLELIAVNEFPGAKRFIGVGELPAEALRLLWPSRKPVTQAQLALGAEAWNALSADDPRQLAALARSGTPTLPIMAPALHRHLRELPSVENGLSLTQHLVLQILSERDIVSLNHVFGMLLGGREPLPWMGDTGLLRTIDAMLQVPEPPFTRVPAPPGERVFRQQLTITDTGRAILKGERDWLSLNPPPRWVGGTHIQAGVVNWRWDEIQRDAVLRHPQ